MSLVRSTCAGAGTGGAPPLAARRPAARPPRPSSYGPAALPQAAACKGSAPAFLRPQLPGSPCISATPRPAAGPLRPCPLVRARREAEDTGEEAEEVNDLGVNVALSMLKFYKREISPLLPSSCRYVPTCSEYSMQAYKRYGVVKGTVLTAWRLCRCNPLGGYGYDPPRWFGEEDLPLE